MDHSLPWTDSMNRSLPQVRREAVPRFGSAPSRGHAAMPCHAVPPIISALWRRRCYGNRDLRLKVWSRQFASKQLMQSRRWSTSRVTWDTAQRWGCSWLLCPVPPSQLVPWCCWLWASVRQLGPPATFLLRRVLCSGETIQRPRTPRRQVESASWWPSIWAHWLEERMMTKPYIIIYGNR